MAQQANAKGSLRNAVRWGILLAAVGTTGFRIPRIVGSFRSWREALRIGDASGAEGWQTILSVELIGALVVLLIGVGVFYLLRERAKAAG